MESVNRCRACYHRPMLPLLGLGFALAASPGPDFFLILRNTVAHGRFIGYMTLLGNRASLCVHMGLAIAGLSAVLQGSPALFQGMQLLGAGYLAYLGLLKLAALGGARDAEGRRRHAAAAGALVAMRDGFLNNLLNPKVSLFFLGLFPQFASRDELAGSPWSVGAAFFVGNSLWWVPLVLVAGVPGLRTALRRAQGLLDALFGVAFLGLGAAMFAKSLSAR